MPKIGMEKVRKQQLIDATLKSIETNGLQGTTISTISKLAEVSTGIISHYFGGKGGLLKEATVYLLAQLKKDFISQFKQTKPTPYERIEFIINANFSVAQSGDRAAVAWLSFWVQSMHSEELAQVQKVNHMRLASNLKFSLKSIIQPEYVELCTDMLAAQIDGQWLRCALSHSSDEQFQQAALNCRLLLKHLTDQYGC
ncbi:MAG: transcriptional regulator BetI [Thalassotalea sp.]|nr:transcriptional regulator BetI [Thalassotalea sp.]